MKPEETIDFHLRNTWLRFAKYYNNTAAEHDGSLTTGFILLNIDAANGTPSTQLGPKMGLESTSLVRPLKTLEEKGLIYRKKDDKDKRVVKIFLTPDGVKKRAVSKETVVNVNTLLNEKLGDNTMKEMIKGLKKISSNLEKLNIDHGKKSC
ncbi:MAG: DNA-binding MarR family transcriptional regulator [Luteibaculaceae bacterium]|jgi:DNA-binding MarR family transcriptional regulator